ncbi:MAG TPA: TonB-dependent receptor [Chitinophagaceae bacterium]|nr:TonB-dependent receptor [Chitinophagaceae bacterium]
MNKMRCMAVLVLLFNTAVSQVIIRGNVIDAATNQPLEGVTVSNLTTQQKAVTGKNGRFNLNAALKTDSLQFTAVGYNFQTIQALRPELFILLKPSFTNLNEIVVSGSREMQRRREVPVSISVLSKTIIDETKATRIDMLVNKVPGVYMVDLGNEQHSMAVRQPIGTKNLFLYLQDGIPIRTTGDFNHNALIEINQASLERIEVIKGPASSLYGSEAVGGAINFITASPSPFLSGKVQVEAGSRGYKRSDFSISNTYKKLGIYFGGYYANQNQPRDEHNDFSKTALTLRADYSFNNTTRLSTVADYIKYKTDQKGGLDSAHFYNKDYVSFYRFTYRKVDAFRLRSTLYKEWNDHHNTTLTFFYRHSAIGQNPFYSISNISTYPLKAKGQVNKDAFKSYGSVLQHTVKLKGIDAKLISGISLDYSPASYIARYIDVDRNASNVYYQYTTTDSLLTNYNVDLLNTAAYTQLEYKPARILKLVAAARYDRLDYRFNNHLLPGSFTGAPDTKDHFDHFSPKLGLTYNVSNNVGAFANYSVGFAPPNITDLYTGVTVPILKASSYTSYEAGGWLSFASGKGSAEASFYRMDGRNEIVSVRLADGSYLNQNAGRTSHKGIETNFRYTPIEDISMRLGGALAEHRYIDYIERGKDYSGYKMAQAPGFVYNGELMYKPRYFKGFRIAGEFQGMNRYFMDPQNTATYKGFTVFNLRLGYSIKAIEFWANCLNAEDQVFATTAEKTAFGTAYRPGQLRTINIGMAYSFRKQ